MKLIYVCIFFSTLVRCRNSELSVDDLRTWQGVVLGRAVSTLIGRQSMNAEGREITVREICLRCPHDYCPILLV
jgi:hypothetical protein